MGVPIRLARSRPSSTESVIKVSAHPRVEFVNEVGQNLAEFLDAEPNARESGAVELRWTFPDGFAVVLGQANCRAV
jgi:hypothetical protein